MNIKKEIPELLESEIITQEIADRILEYYQNKIKQSPNRLLIVFGILGAVLTGLGIILILAHNWDDFSRITKTSFAFIPLLIGQVICGFTLLKRQDSVLWRESGTTFLFFAVGASISLISQIYNMPGNLSSFLLIWMLLVLPMIYVMRSSFTSLVYLIGITYYATETSYWTYPSSESYIYWMLLLGALPHYYLLYKKKPHSNFMTFHNWFIPLSVIITLGTLANRAEELMAIAYFSLFGLFYLIGKFSFFKNDGLRNNGFLVLGSLGTIVMLLIFSFDEAWNEIRNNEFLFSDLIVSPEFIVSVTISLLAGSLLFMRWKSKVIKQINPLDFVFILFLITYMIGLSSTISVIIINLIVFGIGVLTIINGAKQFHLGILNYGLVIILALVVCRFFDTDLSFVMRGGLFVSVGVGFFVTNYWILKKRKINE